MLPKIRSAAPFFCLLSIVICLGNGCNVINPAEPVPTNLRVDTFAFTSTPALMSGSNSHRITAVYAYFNNSPIGVFNLPVTFPVIAGANGTVLLIPAVDLNGLSGLEGQYTFYQPDTFILTPQPGATVYHLAVTHYRDGTTFPFIEDFETNVVGNKFSAVSGSPQLMTFTAPGDSSKVFEGSRSGFLHLANAGDTAANASNIPFFLSADQESFVEINYKSTMPIQIGLSTNPITGGTYTEYLIGLNPRSTWGKVYVSTRSFVGAHQGSSYQLLIRAEVPAGQAGGDLNIDNIKVVTR